MAARSHQFGKGPMRSRPTASAGLESFFKHLRGVSGRLTSRPMGLKRIAGAEMTEFDTGLRILVVEDDRAMASIIRSHVLQLGFNQVDLAGGGASALAMLREHEYRLVISDWKMQPMD